MILRLSAASSWARRRGSGSARIACGLGVFGHRGQVVVAGDRVLEQLDDELALVSEHRVDGLDGDAGFLGDRADAGGAVAVAEEESLCRLQDRPAGRLGLLRSLGGHVSPGPGRVSP